MTEPDWDVLPSTWSVSSIGDVAQVNPRPTVPDPLDDTEVSFVPMAAVGAESGQMDPSTTAVFGEVRKKSYRRFEEGDVVVAKITPSMENGKAAIASRLVGGQAFGSTEFHVLRPGSDIDGRFLLHYVRQQSFRATAARAMTGTAGQLRVPADHLRQSLIPLPPVDEQRRIVKAIETHLSHLDPGVGSLQRAKRNLERMREAVLSEAFTPDWPTSTLGEIAAWGSGGTPRTAVTSYYDGEIPWAVIGDLNDAVVSETARSITRNGLTSSSAKLVAPGTILIAMYGSIGKLGIAGVNMATNQAIAYAVVNEGVILPAYLFWFLRSQRRELVASGKGATQSNISQTVLKAWPIPIPSIVDQAQIVDRIEGQMTRVSALMDALEVAERRAMSLRRMVLEAAFSGDLVVVDFRSVEGAGSRP